ncbi:MAG: hypothetical protein RMZ43_013625 [Nostoc sp. CmiVER01]|uniref:hypothetical protein n=1 Tax=Nostoc sp. CmiVER01 TaxID=3075384 RepID=UPI002AD35960|nr:hypothetical protein [Nostoc sp. CmiVER01]MDZ8124929.1 hypothetical protein [Nostoc sp. CmiVER01]
MTTIVTLLNLFCYYFSDGLSIPSLEFIAARKKERKKAIALLADHLLRRYGIIEITT